ncbi:hypothetical protein [Alterisphingorhabdus coralli]|uniref:Uncharacterized protein n=1 Tax=Alterisphingorhabdus coralli TaxID=3071408 RepID=A0AA97F7W2_9SPHN|nr:hypothetical protein [Parasphingorhabdus sp. SCSIO 66989]WOE75556.1 hypothetical protein RB602_02245 [Parasphingorhabdus sp. SCSIO 66989]
MTKKKTEDSARTNPNWRWSVEYFLDERNMDMGSILFRIGRKYQITDEEADFIAGGHGIWPCSKACIAKK